MGLVDGPGIRTVVFLQGCPLRCVYCHNPEMQEFAETQKYTPEQILKILNRYKPYYKENGGVTFSGGEPLTQSKFLLECLKLCKQNNINTALDTSGIGENYDEILDYVDLVILDVKACEREEYKRITGGDFDKFFKFLNVCQKKKKKMWLRQVIIPNINDDESHILKLKEFIRPLKNIDRIELLPYHTMALKKYEKLKREYPLKGTPQMDKLKCKELEKILLK